MPRVSPPLRDATVARILAGETYPDLSAELDVPEGTLRQWVKRHRDGSQFDVDDRVVKLASDPPPIDLATLDPIALLEHDIADAREDLEGARESKYWNAIPQLRNAVLKMQVDLDVLRRAVPTDKAQSTADKVQRMQEICRVRKLCNLILDDRQARVMLRSCVESLDE